jgi:Ca2+/Na+ antiporter
MKTAQDCSVGFTILGRAGSDLAMEAFQHAANISVGRAVGFGVLAITVIMVSCAFDFALSLRIGFVLTLVMSVILLMQYQRATTSKPERSETWMILADHERPQNEAARAVFVRVLAETYLGYSIRVFSALQSLPQ